MKLGEFFVSLGFDVDDKKLKEFNTNIKDGLKDVLKLSTAAAGAVYAIDKFISGSIDSATAMRNFKMVTGESIQQLQEWQIAGTMANAAMSVDQVTASVQGLNGAIADVQMGKGPSGQFSMLGVTNAGNLDAFQALEVIRRNFNESVQRWGYRNTINNIQAVGIDPAMVNAIKMTREEFDKLIGGRILDPQTQQRLVQLGQSIQSVKRDLAYWKAELSAEIAPTLMDFLDKAGPALADFGKNFKVGFGEQWDVVGPKLQAYWDQLKEFKNWFIAAGALIAIGLAPITSALAGFIYLTAEWGKHLQGIASIFDKISEVGDKVNKWMGLDDESQKRKAEASAAKAEKSFNQTGPHPFSEYLKGYKPLMPGEESLFYSHEYQGRGNMPPQPAPIMNNVTQNNNFEVTGGFDADDVAQEVARMTQSNLNKTIDDFNNGPRF